MAQTVGTLVFLAFFCGGMGLYLCLTVYHAWQKGQIQVRLLAINDQQQPLAFRLVLAAYALTACSFLSSGLVWGSLMVWGIQQMWWP